jgi:hypothetical protein
LCDNGYLLFFSDPNIAPQFLKDSRQLTGDIDAVYNIAMMLYLLAHANGAAYFLTTDDRIVKKLTDFSEIIVMNPTEFIKVLDNYDN